MKISVAKYGAVGDGSTDDTKAIQQAIDAAAKKKGSDKWVVFPPGTYMVRQVPKRPWCLQLLRSQGI